MSYGIFGGIGVFAGGVIGGSIAAIPGFFAESNAHSATKDHIIELQQQSYEAEHDLEAIELQNGDRLVVEIGELCTAIILSAESAEPTERLAEALDADTDQVCGDSAEQMATKISQLDEITGATTQAKANLDRVNTELDEARDDLDDPVARDFIIYGAVIGGVALGAVGLMAARALDN